MTTLHHIGWYNLILANLYVLHGKEGPFTAFLVIAIICIVCYFFERKQ